MTVNAYPLQWPAGWPRARPGTRRAGQFGVAETQHGHGGSWRSKRALSIEDGVKRVRSELERLGVDAADDMVISTNLTLNLRGLPRGDQGAPSDPGVAVYWQKRNQPMRVMAIDSYTRVADNLGAIAATLEAMRAIERHGGAQILDRAFTGFTALPPPRSCWETLGLKPGASATAIDEAYREKAKTAHPDKGGSAAAMTELNQARDAAKREIGA